MSEPAAERFYVISTTGYSLHGGSGQTSYAVCDRAYNGREVFRRYVPSGARNFDHSKTDEKRRAACEAKARELNAKHEPW